MLAKQIFKEEFNLGLTKITKDFYYVDNEQKIYGLKGDFVLKSENNFIIITKEEIDGAERRSNFTSRRNRKSKNS